MRLGEPPEERARETSGGCKRYAFELSGEHPTLPRSEVLALMEMYSSGFRELCHLDQVLVVDALTVDVPSLAKRLSMSHRILSDIIICEDRPEELRMAAENLKLPQGSYRVRVRGVGRTAVNGYDVEKMVGAALLGRGYRADLSCPDIDIRGIVTGHTVVLGRQLGQVDRRGFQYRKPHLKPFFYPGVLMPRMARCLVNVVRVRQGDMLLDPFAGTAGILVEAGLMGIEGLGVEVQRKIARGARANLIGLPCSLALGDARRLPLKDGSVDGVVCDLPYGRSAAIRARSREELLERSLGEIGRVLKARGYAAVVSDREIIDEIGESGFTPVEYHQERVHKSLTRRIHICR